MGRLAKVTSIDVIEHFAAAMTCFGEDAKTSIEGIDMEVRRALNWIQREQKDYWTQRIRRGWDEVNIARKELERKLMFYPGDDRPSAHDERLALEAAKRRLQLAQEKVEAVKRWSHRVQREVNEYIGAIQPLKAWLEFELPKALTDLGRMARALEDYVALESSAEPVFPDELSGLIGFGPATAAQGEETTSSSQPEVQAKAEDSPSSEALEPQAASTNGIEPPTARSIETESAPEQQEKADG
ncbi:MAG: hypothetical protein GXX96_28395 [Planctomycetaceae bacterium]|nr:hypothetical protein [Planctomycetaceae bacterium]